jgi:hypothetical protein
MPRCRDRDGDERAWLIDQTVTLGCGLMAEYGIRARAKQGRPEQRLAWRLARKGREYTSLKPLPSASVDPAAHGSRPYAGLIALAARDGVTLDLEQLMALRRHFM